MVVITSHHFSRQLLYDRFSCRCSDIPIEREKVSLYAFIWKKSHTYTFHEWETLTVGRHQYREVLVKKSSAL